MITKGQQWIRNFGSLDFSDLTTTIDRDMTFKQMIQLCFAHKVPTVVLENLSKVETRTKAETLLLLALRLKVGHLEDQSPKVIENNVSYIIKGEEIAAVYPRKQNRYFQDIDFIVFGKEKYYQLIDELSSNYYPKKLKVFRGLKGERTSEVCLNPDVPGYQLDLHLNPLYIWGKTYYYLRKNKLDRSIEDLYVLVLMGIANEWKYIMRDINDAYVLLNKVSNFEYIEEQIQKYSLSHIDHVIRYSVSQCYASEEKTRLTVSEKLFLKYCFGERHSWAALPMEFLFSFQNYRRKVGIIRAVIETLIDSYNLIRFGRAFYTKKKVQEVSKIKGVATFKAKRKTNEAVIRERYDFVTGSIWWRQESYCNFN